MDSLLAKTSFNYIIYALIKFLSSIAFFYLVFKGLEVQEFAGYALIQSFTAFTGIIFTLNTKASMQRIFSKRFIVPYAQLAYLATFLIGMSIVTILIVFFLKVFPNTENFTLHLIDEKAQLILILYVGADAFYNLTSSYLNAIRRTHLYGVHQLYFHFLLCLILINYQQFNLTDLLYLIICSNIFGIIFLILSFRSWQMISKGKISRFRPIFFYIIKYSIQTLPSNLAKTAYDFSSKSMLGLYGGATALATFSFSLSIFSIFQSVENAIFRAVTPFFLAKSTTEPKQYFFVRNLIISIACLIVLFFSLAIFWIDWLKLIFPNKPSEVFSPLILFCLSIYTFFCYIKNFYLIFMKRSIYLIQSALYFALASYGLGFIGLLFLTPSPVNYAVLLSVLLFFNMLLMRLHPRGVTNVKSRLHKIF